MAEPPLHVVHGLLQGVHLGEMQLEQEAVVSGEAPVQGGDEMADRGGPSPFMKAPPWDIIFSEIK